MVELLLKTLQGIDVPNANNLLNSEPSHTMSAEYEADKKQDDQLEQHREMFRIRKISASKYRDFKIKGFSIATFLALCWMLSWGEVSYGQNQENLLRVPKFSPVSPEAAGLGRYGDVPVGAYTGVPDISIPVHTVKAGELQVPIALAYHATGVKVEQEASWVGLGWNLQAGGSISMTVVGTLDRIFQEGNVPSWKLWEKLLRYPNLTVPSGVQNIHPSYYMGLPEQNYNMFDACLMGDTSALASREVLSFMKKYGNYEQDIYHVNFLNYSFKFILHPNTKEPLFLGNRNKCKIIRTQEDTWIIIGEDGVKYIFNSAELTEQHLGSDVRPNYLSNWKLTRVEHPSGKFINLKYASFGGVTNLPSYSNTFNYNYPGIADPESKSMLSEVNILNSYLSEIETENERVVFYAGLREDLAGKGPRKLDSLVIYDRINSKRQKTYAFGYSYFMGNGVGSDYIDAYVQFFPLSGDYYNAKFPKAVRQKRLKLISVKEIGYTKQGFADTSKNPYLFSYNLTDLPYKTSMAKDHWGFYNGQNNNSDVPDLKDFVAFDPALANTVPDGLLLRQGANRRASRNHIRAGMLEEIIYPTKGKTKFEFEAHTFTNQKYVSVEEEAYIQRMVRVSDYNNPPNQPPSVIRADTFSLKSTASVTLYAGFYGNGGGISQQPQLEWGQLFGAYVVLQHKVNGNYTDMTDHQYYFQSIVDQSKYNTTHNATIDKIFSLPAGEYRLITNLPDALSAQDPYGGNYVTGSIKFMVVNPQVLKTPSIGGGVRIRKISSYDSDNRLLSSISYRYQLNDSTSSGKLMSPLDYLRNKAIRRTRLSNAASCQLDIAYFDTWILTANSSIPLATTANGNHVGYSRVEIVQEGGQGNGKEVNYYTNLVSRTAGHLPPWDHEGNGNIERKEMWNDRSIVRLYDYTYKTLELKHQLLNVQLEDWYVGPDECCGGKEPGVESSVINPFAYNGRGRLYYYPTVSTWNVMESKVEKQYDREGAAITISEFYKYNPTNYSVSQVTTLSSDGSKESRLTTYPPDYAVGTPFIDAMVSANLITAPIEQVSYREDQMGYKKIISGVLTKYKAEAPGLREEVYALETAAPIALGNFKFSNRLKGQFPEIGESATSFSPDAGYKSKILFSRYYKGNPVGLSRTDDIPITYLWGYSNSHVIAEIQNAGYEQVKAVMGISTVDFDLGSGGLTKSQESDLRAKLPQARVITYTYDPLLGMTSSTDANGRTTYYEYDSLGRLSLMKDAEGNLLKTYEYNYKK